MSTYSCVSLVLSLWDHVFALIYYIVHAEFIQVSPSLWLKTDSDRILSHAKKNEKT